MYCEYYIRWYYLNNWLKVQSVFNYIIKKKMRLIAIFVIVLGVVAISCDAKRKRKFEGDFEFAEEVSLKSWDSFIFVIHSLLLILLLLPAGQDRCLTSFLPVEQVLLWFVAETSWLRVALFLRTLLLLCQFSFLSSNTTIYAILKYIATISLIFWETKC